MKFQDILGFGGAFTDAACYTFNRLALSEGEKLFHEMFHASEMGLSVCRICVGSSDYSRTVYSLDKGAPDPEMARFPSTTTASTSSPCCARRGRPIPIYSCFLPVEPAGLEGHFRALTRSPQAPPKDWADSYLAAFARVARLTVVTFGRAFQTKAADVVLPGP